LLAPPLLLLKDESKILNITASIIVVKTFVVIEVMNKMKIVAVLKKPFLKPFAKSPNGTCFQALTIKTTAAE
jgi:hypothetical protein